MSYLHDTCVFTDLTIFIRFSIHSRPCTLHTKHTLAVH